MNWKTFPEEKPDCGDIVVIRTAPEQGEKYRTVYFNKETGWIDGDQWIKLDVVKRKPLSDGTLPLTEEELGEFMQFIKDDVDSNTTFLFQGKIRILEKDVVAVFRSKITDRYHLLVISDYKAILYLAERFNLTGE